MTVFAFSTLVDPAVVGRERARVVADRFLYGDGSYQIFFIFGLSLLMAVSLVLAILNLAALAFRRPSLRVAIVSSLVVGFAITCGFICVLLFIRM